MPNHFNSGKAKNSPLTKGIKAGAKRVPSSLKSSGDISITIDARLTNKQKEIARKAGASIIALKPRKRSR